MRDKIKTVEIRQQPVRLANGSGLKGHVSIELRDGLTGKLQEKTEADNMITAAYDKLINYAMSRAYGMNPWGNAYDTHVGHFFGGLLLFDSAIDTDALYAGAGNKLTGCAVNGYQNSNANIPVMGTYVAAESDSKTTGENRFWKRVYDFLTSQGNGSIGSICLCPNDAGYCGYGNAVGKGYPNTGANRIEKYGMGECLVQTTLGKQGRNDTNYTTLGGGFMDFCIDGDNDLKYMFRVSSNKLEILKHRMTPLKFNPIFRSHEIQPYELKTISANFSGSYWYHFYNTDEKVLYFWSTNQTGTYYSNGFNATIYKYDMETEQLSTHGTFYSAGLGFYYVFGNLVVTNTSVYFCCRPSYNDYGPYLRKFDIASREITNIVGNGSLIINAPQNSFIYRGLLYQKYNGENYGKMIYNMTDGSVRWAGNGDNGYSIMYVPPIDNTQMIFGSFYNANEYIGSYARNFEDQYRRFDSSSYYCMDNLYVLNHFLSTICNLNEPVVKNSTQTMKVVYTITEAAEQ